jgi:hypothetical protein
MFCVLVISNMPKRKTVDPDVVPADTKTRSSATKPKAPAATHKRATKHPAEPAIPVREISEQEISRLAYSYWEARGYQGGSADEDWFRAERELSELAKDR